MAKPDPALLDPARYPFRAEIGTRFADLDPNDHINNVAMAAVVEDARARFIGAVGLRSGTVRFMVANVTIDYLAQAQYPDVLVCHAACAGTGRTSWAVQQLLMQNGAAVAVAHTTIVFTDGARPVPLPADVWALLEPWMLK